GTFGAGGAARAPTEGTQSPSGAAFRAGGSKIIVDEQKHALVIQTVAPEYERILRILRRLDVVTTQVMLEAAIAEVTLTDDLKFGLKWFFEKRHNNFTFTAAASRQITSTFPVLSHFLSHH